MAWYDMSLDMSMLCKWNWLLVRGISYTKYRELWTNRYLAESSRFNMWWPNASLTFWPSTGKMEKVKQVKYTHRVWNHGMETHVVEPPDVEPLLHAMEDPILRAIRDMLHSIETRLLATLYRRLREGLGPPA